MLLPDLTEKLIKLVAVRKGKLSMTACSAVCLVLCFCGRPPGSAIYVPREETVELPKGLLFLVTFGFFLLASWRKKSDGMPKEGSEDSKSVHGPFFASPALHRNSE